MRLANQIRLSALGTRNLIGKTVWHIKFPMMGRISNGLP